MRAGAIGAVERAAVVVVAPLVGAIAGVDAGGVGAADEADEEVRASRELEGADEHQEPGELDEAAEPARRRGRAAMRRSSWQARRHRFPTTVLSRAAPVKRGCRAPGPGFDSRIRRSRPAVIR